ncbi:M20/M25/M40 family metallo-hydrolase [Myxococcus sp. K15C18031901]|uniref:M20/M25/M40 family metallo-hydrolase n=1 Tax=Myxococcus dinghuensis TaxID=2906761 RepID=UPI0020A7C787|nr:M20/M25/M40 family metallo-hydrolase [Myxococcus dinghuensis]MCP3102296.1 M20/M25/M40 family metallo-hydrolase [Myxococcus dinghuensis]
MSRRPLSVVLMLLLPVLASAASPEAERWWGHVRVLADDAMEGRETGSEGYQKAANYVVEQLSAMGIQPGAGAGYSQEVELVSRRLVDASSRLALRRGGRRIPLVIGREAFISARLGESGQVDAPLVFVGYGLSIPEAGHDDFAGLDVRGKVAVFLYGGPAHISGPLVAHHGSLEERVKVLREAGAVGIMMLMHPKKEEMPWARIASSRFEPAMTFADPSLIEDGGLKIGVVFDNRHAEKLFAGAPHTFKEVLAKADANQPLPRFELPTRLEARAEWTQAPVRSSNVVGLLPGSDATLAKEYVVLTAHLDHIGVGVPVKGDAIFNGAMDNATGVAAVLEVARTLQALKPKRSVLFLLVTGEEKGLLGSRYFAAKPTVPLSSIVANFNLDMFLPLFPLTRMVAMGQEESSLEAPLQQVAAAHGVTLVPDPEPDRMLFIRSDQYAFIRKGVPALFFKFGHAPGSPEARVLQTWSTRHYHAPSDDVRQPMDREAAAKFVRLLADLSLTVANTPERPHWNERSFFRRFASAAVEEAGPRTP